MARPHFRGKAPAVSAAVTAAVAAALAVVTNVATNSPLPSLLRWLEPASRAWWVFGALSFVAVVLASRAARSGNGGPASPPSSHAAPHVSPTQVGSMINSAGGPIVVGGHVEFHAAPAAALAPKVGDPQLVHAGIDPYTPVSFAGLKAEDSPRSGSMYQSSGALDFKFVNRGFADSLITECRLDVVDFTLDERPVIEFVARVDRRDVDAGCLVIRATNRGWGPPEQMTIRLRDTVLEQAFPQSALETTLLVEPEKEQDVLVLDPAARASGLLAPEHGADEHGAAQRETTLPLRLSANVEWRNQWDSTFVSGGGYQLMLGPNGFTGVRLQPPMLAMSSSAAYAVVLPAQPATSLTFRIDQMIRPGGSDRFHIVLAATISGTFTIKVTFTTDTGRSVESPPMTIHLWCPRGARLPTNLAPGQPFRKVHGGFRLDRPYVPPPYPRETWR